MQAKPMWQGVPYLPHPQDLPLTVPQEPRLHTVARAVQRGEFDLAMDDKARAQDVGNIDLS